MIDPSLCPPAAPEPLAEVLSLTLRKQGAAFSWSVAGPLEINRRRGTGLGFLAACLVLALGACTHPVDCSGGNYRGGCFAGAEPAAPMPVTVSPARIAPATVGRGDPADFADVDDKQCRSYGLLFGSHDYADCRIKLSAQHRGLDPNIGATAPLTSPAIRP